ncbi:ABC transporter ATP-binding protein [Aneurinibacillus danicus]|jgi:ABC-type polysaccharide/polyol phosphate transport system ATPase subunit|uniref:Teichoic acid ABC transporter ATP-binding protein n=1 Tax=Aneurinibacillus danicus TaxID=267746 RepID=A0A511V886_9BACL|nr:ABC transporter ATP-binding protein [Aneurinibacillus danicus]GEN35146.1 teichoic acid ABC transporter ATP-binding protein [Aneurinibacillus danicus]
MSNDNIAIRVENLKKAYKIYDKPVDRLKESLHPLRKIYHKDFYALKGVSFDIKRGETVGIIGKNGSGKSTLLKIITGVLTPTFGEVQINGKISALLELGAGFNPELTGIENIYLNGTIMGFTKQEMDKRLDDILSFADIGNFVYQPVKTYSSGMFARLAFSVAINIEPDILIVDEALSVGDMQFQEKSFTKMKRFRDLGKSILFVTHSLTSVRNFCDRAIWISEGSVQMDGQADLVCSAYQDSITKEEKIKVNTISNSSAQEKTISIKNVTLDKQYYLIDEPIKISVELDFYKEITEYGVGIIIYDSKGNIVTLFNTVRDDIYFDKTYSKFTLVIPENDFTRGRYYITVSISDELAMFSYDKAEYVATFLVESKKNKHGIPIADGFFRSKHLWEY